MKRLTARTETGHAYLVNVKPDEQEVDSPHKNTLQCILDCFERLAQYEDAEEQGRCVVLPCKVGDTVYKIAQGMSLYKPGFIPYVVEVEPKSLSEICQWVEDGYCLGKTVFLTRAEAENAIAND